MIAFWISAAVVAAAALGLLLRPALGRRGVSRSELNASVYRDQLRELEGDLQAGTLARADYERSRAEIERRLLEDVKDAGAPAAKPAPAGRSRAFALAGAIGVPLLALGIYFVAGNPGALDPLKRQGEDVGLREIEAMVQRLAERLEKNPEDVAGWKMLGKSYSVMGRFAEAATAYSKAAMRAPRDPQILADLADALAMARGQKMAGEPEELVQRALQIDPRNAKALALAGTAAFEKRDFSGAASYWERMLPLVPPDSEDWRTIQTNIEEARAQVQSGSAPKTKDAGAAKKGAAAGLEGTISLSPRLAAKVQPGDTLFVFARATEGPPMPIAILRRRAADLPLRFTLDDSSAMSPQRKLSSFPKVVVVARVSKSGNAAPQPGDLLGASAAVANTARGLNIVIDAEVGAK